MPAAFAAAAACFFSAAAATRSGKNGETGREKRGGDSNATHPKHVRINPPMVHAFVLGEMGMREKWRIRLTALFSLTTQKEDNQNKNDSKSPASAHDQHPAHNAFLPYQSTCRANLCESMFLTALAAL